MWSNKKGFKYESSNQNTNQNTNQALKYTTSIMKSPIMQTNANIVEDYNEILKGGCIYLPNFFCPTAELSIFNDLKTEINDSLMVNWSKHHKFEDPQFSVTFNKIIDQMAKHFNVKVIQTRMNYYKDHTAYKPLHRDSHAFYVDENNNREKENFTMGASFGCTRALDFVHESTNSKFTFPQNNGDVFAFNSQVNDKFLHGVPKLTKKVISPVCDRISIIAWGIRS